MAEQILNGPMISLSSAAFSARNLKPEYLAKLVKKGAALNISQITNVIALKSLGIAENVSLEPATKDEAPIDVLLDVIEPIIDSDQILWFLVDCPNRAGVKKFILNEALKAISATNLGQRTSADSVANKLRCGGNLTK